MKIQFLGATREVTGSRHLLILDNGRKILLDCGLYQGKGHETDAMNRDLGFDPKEIDTLVLSHAHIDHSGNIPYLFKNGFRGNIFCTPATRDLCSIMLLDCAHIQEHDTKTNNKKLARQGKPPVEPLYTTDDANRSINLFVSIPYDRDFRITDEVVLRFTDAGHILGSAAVNLTVTEKEKVTRLCFTGDIGRYEGRILKKPAAFPQADYIICESTYGDRLHESPKDAERNLLEAVVDTCVRRRGKLIIPAFSIGRTQEIVYALDRLETARQLPPVDVYVDSPLSTNATNIMRLHPECFNREMLDYMITDPDPFGFNRLHYVRSIDESKALNATSQPCIIISASGMMEAGRVKHHLANSISDARNTVLVVGYCAPSTLGARIVNGDTEVSIFGQVHPVKADVRILESFSAHGDYQEMFRFLSCQDFSRLKKTFLVHGEFETQVHYKKFLQDKGINYISIPEKGDLVELYGNELLKQLYPLRGNDVAP